VSDTVTSLLQVLGVERLADDHRRELAAEVVALDEVLHMQRREARDFAVYLGDEEARRGVAGDASDPLSGLVRGRGVAQLVEQRSDALGVVGARFPDRDRYGGGGGGPPGGGPSSSTYVERRPPQPP
jgi:hypothetical protein